MVPRLPPRVSSKRRSSRRPLSSGSQAHGLRWGRIPPVSRNPRDFPKFTSFRNGNEASLQTRVTLPRKRSAPGPGCGVRKVLRQADSRGDNGF